MMYTMHTCRLLVTHVPMFEDQACTVTQHIGHEYSAEMSTSNLS